MTNNNVFYVTLISSAIFVSTGYTDEYYYNKAGQLEKTVTSSGWIYEYTYNEHGDVENETTTKPNGDKTTITSVYEYNSDNSIHTKTTGYNQYTYVYLPNGKTRVIAKKVSNGKIYGIEDYDAYGNKQTVVAAGMMGNNYDYDTYNNRLTGYKGSGNNDDWTYLEYNDDGTLKQKSTESFGYSSWSGYYMSISYDEYTYNDNGQPISHTQRDCYTHGYYQEYDHESAQYTDFNDDECTTWSQETYKYHPNGKLKEYKSEYGDMGEVSIYTYDEYGNLIRGATSSYGEEYVSSSYEYTYDGNGHILSKKDLLTGEESSYIYPKEKKVYRIYTIEEANAVTKPTGNRVSIRYK